MDFFKSTHTYTRTRHFPLLSRPSQAGDRAAAPCLLTCGGQRGTVGQRQHFCWQRCSEQWDVMAAGPGPSRVKPQLLLHLKPTTPSCCHLFPQRPRVRSGSRMGSAHAAICSLQLGRPRLELRFVEHALQKRCPLRPFTKQTPVSRCCAVCTGVRCSTALERHGIQAGAVSKHHLFSHLQHEPPP